VQKRPARQDNGGNEAEHHQGEILGRSELQRDAGKRRREEDDDERRDRAGDERADRRRGEGATCLALACHLIAVQRRHDGRGLAGEIDKDRGRRAAVLRTVVDASQHDQRGFRRQPERDRQQHCDRRNRAETGQHADGSAEENTDEAVEKIDRRESGLETDPQIA